MTIPDISIPPLKNVAYFGGSKYAPPSYGHKRKPIIWAASGIDDGAGNTLQIEWSKRKWGEAAAGTFPANHPDLGNQNFDKGLPGDFFGEAVAFFNAGNLPNAINDHLLMGDIIIGKDIEGNVVRLKITEQNEIAAQGMIL